MSDEINYLPREQIVNNIKKNITILESKSRSSIVNPAKARVHFGLYNLESRERSKLTNTIKESIISSETHNKLVTRQNRLLIYLTIAITAFTIIITIFGGIEIWDKFFR